MRSNYCMLFLCTQVTHCIRVTHGPGEPQVSLFLHGVAYEYTVLKLEEVALYLLSLNPCVGIKHNYGNGEKTRKIHNFLNIHISTDIPIYELMRFSHNLSKL